MTCDIQMRFFDLISKLQKHRTLPSASLRNNYTGIYAGVDVASCNPVCVCCLVITRAWILPKNRSDLMHMSVLGRYYYIAMGNAVQQSPSGQIPFIFMWV